MQIEEQVLKTVISAGESKTTNTAKHASAALNAAKYAPYDRLRPRHSVSRADDLLRVRPVTLLYHYDPGRHHRSPDGHWLLTLPALSKVAA